MQVRLTQGGRRLVGLWNIFDKLNAHPRVITLGLLSAAMLVIFGLSEFLLLRQLEVPAHLLPLIDLLVKLSLVAAFLSFCLFALELRAEYFNSGPKQSRQDDAASKPLPGLVQKPALAAAVEVSIRQGIGGVMLLISFRSLSDSLTGERVAGVVKNEMLLRLKEHVPSGSLIAAWRNSGFAVLVPGEGAGEIKHLADSIAEHCKRPVCAGVRTLNAVPAVGLVDLSCTAFERSDQVLHAARIALWAAEASESGESIVIYDTQLEARALDRETLSQTLPRAIYDRQLEVYLQPRVALDSERVCGFEALVRWEFEGRLLDACDIIAIAELSGVIVELDRFMVDEAVRLVADWNRRRKTEFSLSVNLSSAHFLGSAGMSFIEDALERHGFPPHLLTIEIAKTDILVRDGPHPSSLDSVLAIGCRLSIDDFGTGRSTLGDLRFIPADEIKIDGSLIDDLDKSSEGGAILAALLEMADHLKIETVVEGVERPGQAAALRQLGCPRAQGFLFGKPRPATEWLADATFRHHDSRLARQV